MMKKAFIFTLGLIGWASVIGQYFLMLDNSVAPIPETTIRFFSYFTILTNGIVALYFTGLLLPVDRRPRLLNAPGTATAITVYITVVGLIYQVVLRPLWHPEGWQWWVNESLHSLIPVAVIVFWFGYGRQPLLPYSKIIPWLLYPLLYLIFILIRGSFSRFYPYPFVDVTLLGMTKVLLNSGLLCLLFVLISALYIFIGGRGSRITAPSPPHSPEPH